MKLPADSRMVDYLLGRLDAAAIEEVRGEILATEEGWERVEAAEQELIDSYARGELDQEHRLLVEQRLLWSDKGQSKLMFALALAKREKPRRARWSSARLVFAAAAMFLVMIG